ncbi:MAG: cysteine desulfurase [Deltaproteobacteria bacterium]|nr:cysteine desulfurase [Deltaproteobacteria bacterium]
MRRIYLDANATTPMAAEVVEAMWEWLGGDAFGNPSSLHRAGREARKAIDDAREQVAALVGAEPSEIVFTSGGTEANNLAVMGAVRAAGLRRIVTSAVEHPSLLEAARGMERESVSATLVGVDRDGVVDREAFRAAIPDGAAFVSLMRVNNETGNLMPVRDCVWELRGRGVVTHTDATQAVGRIGVDVKDLGVDFMSMSAHKLHGPKGVGALYVRRGARLSPILVGGAQERERRAGTENVAGIVGFGKAAALAHKGLKPRAMKIAALRDRFERELFQRVEGVRLNGHRLARAPGTLNVSFDKADGEAILIGLDLERVAASSGAACASGVAKPSHVLLAMGRTAAEARSSVRFSFHDGNTDEEVDRLIEIVPAIVARVRCEEGPGT